MKTSLDHLPENKQQAVKEIRRLILNEVDEFLDGKTGKKNQNRVAWIVLFGSYARGDYVEDPAGGYISDFDVLVVINRQELVNELALWHAIEDKIDRLTRCPITLIVHSQKEVTQWLEQGHYIFSDIQREGVYLHSHSSKALPEPKLLTNAERLPIAEKHYKQCFEAAEQFLYTYGVMMEKDWLKLVAFNLHQGTERYYATLLLVLSNYRPKTHNLKSLHQLSLDIVSDSSELKTIFKGKDKFERRCFELLKRSYVDSRYSEHFKNTAEELDWLVYEVQKLKVLVEELCAIHISTLKK